MENITVYGFLLWAFGVACALLFMSLDRRQKKEAIKEARRQAELARLGEWLHRNKEGRY